MGVEQENWKSAAVRASNLSGLELTLGDVHGAVRDAEQSVDFADRSGDADQRIKRRTTLADAPTRWRASARPRRCRPRVSPPTRCSTRCGASGIAICSSRT
jgi:hypothetical protein